jgi:uncharacterized protein with HEPN domain
MRMRDRLIHHYESMEPSEVWQAAKEDVPVLLAFVQRLIGEEG